MERDRGYVYLLVELLWFGADDVSALSSQSAESDNVMCAEADSLQCGVLHQTLQLYGP